MKITQDRLGMRKFTGVAVVLATAVLLPAATVWPGITMLTAAMAIVAAALLGEAGVGASLVPARIDEEYQEKRRGGPGDVR